MFLSYINEQAFIKGHIETTMVLNEFDLPYHQQISAVESTQLSHCRQFLPFVYRKKPDHDRWRYLLLEMKNSCRVSHFWKDAFSPTNATREGFSSGIFSSIVLLDNEDDLHVLKSKICNLRSMGCEETQGAGCHRNNALIW